MLCENVSLCGLFVTFSTASFTGNGQMLCENVSLCGLFVTFSHPPSLGNGQMVCAEKESFVTATAKTTCIVSRIKPG